MRTKPLILLTLIVILPVAGLAWLGLRVAHDDEAALQQRFEEVFAVQLQDIDATIDRHFQSLMTDLRFTAQQVGNDADEIRSLLRDSANVRQVLVLDRSGRVLHPDPATSLNLREREFLNEAQELIQDRDLIHAAEIHSDVSQSTNSAAPTANQTVTASEFDHSSVEVREGWHAWYWGRGIHLIFWQRRNDGTVVGLLVERGRWMADLIAALPETVDRNDEGVPVDTTSRFRLVDSMGKSMYEWGGYEPTPAAKPLVELAVSAPLTSWRLQAIVPDALLSGANRGATFQLASGIAAVAVALSVLAVFFWREYAREVRQALQRVSFVNQVSHELKTPLTNIRMYADLLSADLDDLNTSPESRSADRLRVIVSESQRLSRLISNVLTFGRQQRQTLMLRPCFASVDDIVQHVLEQFTPTLERLGIQIELELAAAAPVSVDQDAVEQILVNLISNVEKYAAGGGLLKISTSINGSLTTIAVKDGGPGIPVSMHRAVFEPFVRVSSRLEDAAGTGIGLSIARDLARLHGGDLRIVDTQTGACFCVELQTPRNEGTE